MKAISELRFGFSDAENYKRREEKELFSKFFLRTDALEKICQPSTFFLIGEKGTGKTAYAVHLSAAPYKGTSSDHRFVRETDYRKFIALKRKSELEVSDYTDIWKVIIYLLMANALIERDKKVGELLQFPKFVALKNAIDEYYNHAFAPEIRNAMQFVEDTSRATEVLLKYNPVSIKQSDSGNTRTTTGYTNFQINLAYIEKTFREALSSLKLSDNQLLFIDGIDIRPSTTPYSEYLDCVKGLGNAVWALNNDVFPSFKDSKGRLRAIALLRPDIFNSLGLQNRNTKLKDNSTVLGWLTNYRVYRSSELFALADRMFSVQQNTSCKIGEAWDYYFPFDAKSVESKQSANFSSFILFLRYSLYRPRDILTALDLLRDIFKHDIIEKGRVFSYDDVLSNEFKKAYGDYALGEIKDALSFYYDEEEYELFLKFFEYLSGAKSFGYDAYIDAFTGFSRFLENQDRPRPSFMKTPEEFLQFLYDQNVLCFIENARDEKFIRWCFRERTPSNPSPKVKTGMEYELHYALSTVLNTGKRLSKRTQQTEEKENYQFGEVARISKDKKFGFIRQDGLPLDIYFSMSKKALKVGDRVKYLLKEQSGKLRATDLKGVK